MVTSPIRLFLGLAQQGELIARAKLLACTEAGAALACTVLLEDLIDTAAYQLAEQKVRRLEGITEQDILLIERASIPRSSVYSSLPLPLQGAVVALSNAPLTRQISVTIRQVRTLLLPGFKEKLMQ